MKTDHIEGLVKVRYDKNVEVAYLLNSEKDGEVSSHPFPKAEVPPPDFIDALQALGPHALKIAGIKLERNAKIEVRELSLSNVEGDDYDFQIKAVVYPAKGPGSFALNTPPRSTRKGSNKAPQASVFEAIDKLLILTMNYLRGDRAQLDAFAENGQAKEEEEPEAVEG